LCLALTIGFLWSPTATPDTRLKNKKKTRVTTTDPLQRVWEKAKKFYIVVAANKYKTSNADLPFAEVDGSKVVATLEAAGYKPVGSGLLTAQEATRDKFIRLLKEVQAFSEDSRVVVYYSGHGVVDSNERDLWLQMYGQEELGEHLGVAASEIVQVARGRSYTGELAIILDSCFSGQGSITSNLTLRDLGPKLSILTSSSSVQESQKIKLGPGQEMSAFTYALIRAIGEDWDKVDSDEVGVVTYTDLERYARSTLKTWFKAKKIDVLMEPGLIRTWDMVFAYNGAKAKKKKGLKRDLLGGDELEAELSTADKLIQASPSTISNARVVSPLSVRFQYPNPTASARGLAARFQYPNPSPSARVIAAQIHVTINPYFLALKAIAERRFADVVPLLNKAERLQFSALKVMRARAWAAIYAGRYAEAAAWYKRTLSLDALPSGPLTLEAANALHLAGEREEAETLYKEFITSAEKTGNLLRPAARNNLGTMYATHGDWVQAQTLYQEALTDIGFLGDGSATKLDRATVSKNLAYVYQERGDADKAAALEREADRLRADYERLIENPQRVLELPVGETNVVQTLPRIETLTFASTGSTQVLAGGAQTPQEMPMHYWIIAVIGAIGALGGFMNVFIGDPGLHLPKTEDGVWQPGFLGVVVVGCVAAVGSWATLKAVQLIGTHLTPLGLTSGDVANALLIGFAGAKWFKSESDKDILRKAAGIAAATKVEDPDAALTIATGTPMEALRAAMGMKRQKSATLTKTDEESTKEGSGSNQPKSTG
jgi:tetratricopeptide (TPR) repeat protein